MIPGPLPARPILRPLPSSLGPTNRRVLGQSLSLAIAATEADTTRM